MSQYRRRGGGRISRRRTYTSAMIDELIGWCAENFEREPRFAAFVGLAYGHGLSRAQIVRARRVAPVDPKLLIDRPSSHASHSPESSHRPPGGCRLPRGSTDSATPADRRLEISTQPILLSVPAARGPREISRAEWTTISVAPIGWLYEALHELTEPFSGSERVVFASYLAGGGVMNEESLAHVIRQVSWAELGFRLDSRVLTHTGHQDALASGCLEALFTVGYAPRTAAELLAVRRTPALPPRRM